MRDLLRLPPSPLPVAALLLCVAVLLPACGPTVEKAPGGSGGSDEEAQPAPGGSDREAVQWMFEAYAQAISRRDFAAACGNLTVSAQREFVENARKTRPRVASCPDAFIALAAARSEEGGSVLDLYVGVARTARVADIRVRGNQATIRSQVRFQGRPLRLRQTARQEGDQWKLNEAVP
jgi:hypothetical protein